MAESSSGWTDELKQEIIAAYVDREPTPETSMDIVKELAEEYNKTVNGVRIILSKAEVYVKTQPAAKGTSSSKSDGPKKISKADAMAQLRKAIEASGSEVNEKIVDKLTGLAAVYFAEVITKATGN